MSDLRRTTQVEVAMQRCYAAWELEQAPSPNCADLVVAAVTALDCDPQTPGTVEAAVDDLFLLQERGVSIHDQAEYLADLLFVCR